MTLAACGLLLAACAGYPEAWSLHLLPVNFYLWPMFLPTIAHDLELSCDGLQLARGSVINFYCEFFHFFFSGSISFFTSRNISSIASAILFNCFSFINSSYFLIVSVSWRLKLEAWSSWAHPPFFSFLISGCIHGV